MNIWSKLSAVFVLSNLEVPKEGTEPEVYCPIVNNIFLKNGMKPLEAGLKWNEVEKAVDKLLAKLENG